jgi:NADH:ubiquinone oxidoreductase subunit 2 (subunit N)
MEFIVFGQQFCLSVVVIIQGLAMAYYYIRIILRSDHLSQESIKQRSPQLHSAKPKTTPRY